jgi:ADP-heptose:LPS heptosyltransferase
MLHLIYMLGVTPELVNGEKYLDCSNDRQLINKWHLKLPGKRRKIGLAWSIGKPSKGDYPREIDLEQLVKLIDTDAELHSVQSQDFERAEKLGVIPHEFEDFSDCAAMMRSMDEIISVDTAALHLSGAIGHPKVYGLLSSWASWRWVANWYDNVKLLRQTSENDWASALEQR